jgi:Bacterial regulatory proteins, luxR family
MFSQAPGIQDDNASPAVVPPIEDATTERREARRAGQAPVLLVFGCKPERLLDSEQRMDAFLDPPTQEQAPTMVDAVASGLGGGASVIVLVPDWLPDEVMVRLDMTRSILDSDRPPGPVAARRPMAGRSPSDIAQELFITNKTVKNHLSRIYEKIGVHSRAEAIALWLGVRREST